MLSARRTSVLVVAVVGVLAAYLLLRAAELVATGSPRAIALALGVLLLVALGVVLVVAEVRLATAAQRLAAELAAEGGLPPDDLPRLPSGRIDRDAADAVFDVRRAEVEAAPDDWRGWYRLAVAYGDARDASRGREAMRRAVTLHRTTRQPPLPE